MDHNAQMLMSRLLWSTERTAYPNTNPRLLTTTRSRSSEAHYKPAPNKLLWFTDLYTLYSDGNGYNINPYEHNTSCLGLHSDGEKLFTHNFISNFNFHRCLKALHPRRQQHKTKNNNQVRQWRRPIRRKPNRTTTATHLHHHPISTRFRAIRCMRWPED